MRNLFDLRGIFTNINTRTIYLYAIVIGILAGLGAVIFNALLHAAIDVTMHTWVRLDIPASLGEASAVMAAPEGPPRRWLLVVLPVVGGLIAGLLVKTFAPEAEGTGTDSYIDAFHNKGGAMRRRVPLVKSLATIATLSSGGSAGKEGPIAQIGAGVGSFLGQYLKMGARARRTLMVAGAAGGLGAIFRAPLGGALTAVEVLYKEDLETDALTPAILSSVTAYTLFCSINGFSTVFAFENAPFQSPIQLLFYVVLGLVCSASGYAYVLVMHESKRVFDRLPLNKYMIPPIGGLLVGCIGYFHPQVMGQGFGYVQQLILGQPIDGLRATVGFLALLAALKIVTTSFTIASGGSGGVFAPSLFIGAMLGGAVGTLSHQLFPDLVPSVAPYVVVGMGAFFAGVANAPIASLMMVCELTGAYELLPPLMVVATVALVTSRRWSIYYSQVDNKFFSRAHLWEMNPNVLKNVTIQYATRGVYDRDSILSNKATLAEMEAIAAETGDSDFILENGEGELAGLVSLGDIGDREDLEHLHSFVLAHDLVNRRLLYLHPEDNLISALEFFGDREFDKLPIVEDRDGRKILLGHVQYRDILKFYRREHGHDTPASVAAASSTGS